MKVFQCLLAAGSVDPCDTAGLSEADHREIARFAAYIRSAAHIGQERAYELVYGESTPEPRGEA